MQRRLKKVKTKMAIHAHRRTLELLDGEYQSIHHGRSHDFDDLREYAPGDEVKDIDWKATARSAVPLVKRYVASRQHTVTFVVDTGRNMAAVSEGGEPKAEVAISVIGMLASIATRHGDRVAMHTGDAERVLSSPSGGSEAHLERLLRSIDERISLDAPPSDLLSVLERVVSRVRRRSLIVVVADDLAYTRELDAMLGRLQARHEVLWLSVGDADLMARRGRLAAIFGVADDDPLPDYVRRDRSLTRAFDDGTTRRRRLLQQELLALGIVAERVPSSDLAMPTLVRLLQRHRRVRR